MPLTQVSSRAIEDTLRYVLGASGTDHYTFTGKGLNGAVNDPTIYLVRGQTYIFENRSGGHPFYIKTSIANGGTNDAYNTGVTNNGGGNGTEIVFTVPHDAPDTLYYQCSIHSSMSGEFKIAGSVADGSITTQKLATDAVDNSKLADQAVTLDKLPHGTSSDDGKFLRANNGADPSYEAIAQPDLTNLSASNLTSGTIPDARFPATLPAADGSNLTNLPAATSTSGTDDFTVADGNFVVGTAGHGIDFSAQTAGGSPYTSSSSGNNTNPVEGELLDHYESGRWTPTIDYGMGDYTKVGNLVIIGFQWTRHGWTDMSLSSGDSAIKISGLPFTPKDSGATGVVNIPALNYTGRTSNGQGGATVLIPPNSAYMLISGLSGTTPRFHVHAMFSVAY